MTVILTPWKFEHKRWCIIGEMIYEWYNYCINPNQTVVQSLPGGEAKQAIRGNLTESCENLAMGADTKLSGYIRFLPTFITASLAGVQTLKASPHTTATTPCYYAYPVLLRARRVLQLEALHLVLNCSPGVKAKTGIQIFESFLGNM